MLWAGDWRRPYDYGDPKGETMAVHDGAGLIDVSTLGKLIVGGPQADEFLNRCTRTASTTSRPGGFATECSATTPGGSPTTARSAGSTTSPSTSPRPRAVPTPSRAGSRGGWRSGTGRPPDRRQPGALGLQPRAARARARSSPGSPISTAPTSRSPISTASAPTSADVPCLLLRIGFVGELGYELHCPGGPRRAPVGHDPGGRRAARDQAVRPRAPARAAPAEAAHPRRPGHRRGVEPARGGDALDRQVRQGGGLHRSLGAGVGAPSGATRTCWWASPSPTARCRPRARRCWPTASRSGG